MGTDVSMFTNRKVSPRWPREHLLLLLTAGGIALGFILGFRIRDAHPSADVLTWIGMPGELFIRMLKLIVIPLIASSVITATASINTKKSTDGISLISFVIVIVINTIACLIAIVLVIFMKADIDGGSTTPHSTSQITYTSDVFADLLRNIIPDNMLDMTFRQTLTQNEAHYETIHRNTVNGTVEVTVKLLHKNVNKTAGTNLLGIITTCILIGIGIRMAEEKGKPVLDFFTSSADVFLKLIHFIICFTPLAIMSLIAVCVIEMTRVEEIFQTLGMLVTVYSVNKLLLCS